MKITTKLFLTFIVIIAMLPFVSASGCYYNPNGGVVGCRSVITWGNFDSSIKSQTLSYAKGNPGERYMAWCPTQNAVPSVRSDSKLSTCGCPSESSFNSYLDPGECDTKKCSNCGNYVSYCRPKLPPPPPPTCTNECSAGETKCVGSQVYKCGDFDTDSCLEWGFKTDCSYYVEGQPTFKCEAGSSVQYKDNKEGFCKDVSGHHDYCDSKTTTERISSEYCGDSSCTQAEQCVGDDIFFIKKCNGECNQNTGKCTYGSDDKTKIEECGQDNCISHTNLNPFVFEYVEDNSGCIQNENAYCGYDTTVFDMCVGDTLLQPYCKGKDHAIQEFDCSSLTGCYDFAFTECVKCDDDEGNCVAKNCTRVGKEYRDYNCGSGKCQYAVSVHDIDKDRVDDRCDNCIDVDKDGACDFENDNCIGVYNPSQIDTDKDGLGNDCDIDRDGDGYAAGYDCNDWNPRVHPFAIEIENNDLDDDCNSDTVDMVADTPHQIFYVDTSMSDIVKAGNSYTFVVSVTNMAEQSVKDVKLSASLPELQLKESRDIGKLKKGAIVSRVFTFNIPKDTEGYKYLRITVSNDQYKRVIYKEIKIVTGK